MQVQSLGWEVFWRRKWQAIPVFLPGKSNGQRSLEGYSLLLLLLLQLSHFSRVRLCATPSLGFSRQEHWSGLPFPSPMHKSESEVAQSCPSLRDPMDRSSPGPSIHGILQARVPEWGAIAFSGLQFRGSQRVGHDRAHTHRKVKEGNYQNNSYAIQR